MSYPVVSCCGIEIEIGVCECIGSATMPKARRAGSKLERISRPFSDGCPGVCPGLPKPIFPPDWDSFKGKRQKNYGNRNHKNNNTPSYIPSLTGPCSSSMQLEILLTDHSGCEEASTSTGLSQDSGLVAAGEVLSPIQHNPQ